MDKTAVITILGAALAVSEALSLIPAVKANGLLHGIYSALKAVYDSLKK